MGFLCLQLLPDQFHALRWPLSWAKFLLMPERSLMPLGNLRLASGIAKAEDQRVRFTKRGTLIPQPLFLATSSSFFDGLCWVSRFHITRGGGPAPVQSTPPPISSCGRESIDGKIQYKFYFK